ncbi:MAG: hypothetical protein R3Y26_06245 [Rikenellaceae bacterium]
MKMKTDFKIFYSWQSDVGKHANRTYIAQKIEEAISKITTKNEFIKISFDESTRGDSSSPDIKDTIIRKITNCDIFICDVTPIIIFEERKAIPNPNVMFELGYAVSSLGWDRIILVWNDCYGDSKLVPFDIYSHRRTHYDKDSEKNKTTKSLDLELPLNTIITKFDSIISKGIPQQELKFDVEVYRKLDNIFSHDELFESITHFRDTANYTEYACKKWSDLEHYYKNPSNKFLDQNLDLLYCNFIGNLQKVWSAAISYTVDIKHCWICPEPDATDEEKENAQRSNQYKLKEFYAIYSDHIRAYKEQEKAINSIMQACNNAEKSYSTYKTEIRSKLFM